MACTLNHAVYHRALGAAHAGHVDHSGKAVPQGAERNVHNSIGHDTAEAGKADEWKYPIFTADGELSAEHVGSALGYAKKNDEHELIGPLQGISDAIAAKKTMSRVIYAMTAIDGDAEPHLALGSNLPKTRNGLPCHYWWRDAARDGDWYNAKRGYSLHVDPDVRRGWAQNFDMMKAAGDEVPVVKDHREDADATLGYVVGVKNDGDRYRELHQYLGDQARDTALKNKISVGVDPNYIDSQKRRIGPAIVHSAVTCRPAIPGEQDAIRVMSRSGEEIELVQLSKSDTAPGSESASAGASNPDAEEHRSPAMQTLKCSKETLDALHKHVPGLKDAHDDDKLARVAQHLQTMSDADMADAGLTGNVTMSAADIHEKAVKARQEWKESHGKLAAAEAAKAEAEKKASDAETKIQTMSKAAAGEPEPDHVSQIMMSRSMTTELNGCVESGGVDANTAKKLGPFLMQNGKPTLFAMSKVGEDSCAGFELLAILKENKPKVMGPQTGIQTMSRANSDNGGGSDESSKKTQQRMIAIANGKNPDAA